MPIYAAHLRLRNENPVAIDEAAKVVTAVRSNIRYFHSSQYINDLANGDICVAHGYSGDILQARDRAAEADNGVDIAYAVPSEGAVVWTDVMAIPADAPNPKAANTFINYLLDPKIAALNTNTIRYANANRDSMSLISPAIRNNPILYTPINKLPKPFMVRSNSPQHDRDRSRVWLHVLKGENKSRYRNLAYNQLVTPHL